MNQARKDIISRLYRNAKPVESYFTGYSVQLLNSRKALPPEHQVFHQFGGIMYESQLDSAFSYLIGEFKTKRGAQKFLESSIIFQYPKAVVISFANGHRLK